MSQHSGPFFPKRAWPVVEDVLSVLSRHYNLKGHFHIIVYIVSVFTSARAFQTHPGISGKLIFSYHGHTAFSCSYNTVLGEPSHPHDDALRSVMKLFMYSCQQVVLLVFPLKFRFLCRCKNLDFALQLYKFSALQLNNCLICVKLRRFFQRVRSGKLLFAKQIEYLRTIW